MEKKQAFSDLGKQVQSMLIDRRQKNGDSPSLRIIEEFGNIAVELLEQLEIIAATPKHTHGPTYRTDASDHSQNPTYNQHEHFSQTTYTPEVSVVQERVYRIGKDLIISTSGQFVFRPKSCLLLTAVGPIKLSKIESQALYDRMKFDYGLS
ncbi:hypothetical protein [Spirosoma flavum]|uniref:Uncharacterized protein n=1 Tax=Spirosoma flavum TaxID=2048557 RepID=A0ABW6ARL9_9BACT